MESFLLDRDVFSDADFAAAEVSDIPINTQTMLSTEEEFVAGPSRVLAEEVAVVEPSGVLVEEMAVAGPSGVVKSSFVVSPKDIIPLPKQLF